MRKNTTDLRFECWVKAQRTGKAAYVIGNNSRGNRVIPSEHFVPTNETTIHWIEWPEGWQYGKA